MSDGQTSESTETPVLTGMTGAELGDAIAKGIAAGQPARKVSFGEYARRPDPVFHPNGHVVRMKRPYFQNGSKIEYATTHDREIELLNRITHSGRYINRLVEVVVYQDGADDAVDIRFNNKTADMQIELKGYCRNFTDMLQQIVDAQELEDLEEEERKSTSKPGRVSAAPIPRPFGNSKATNAAYDAAKK